MKKEHFKVSQNPSGKKSATVLLFSAPVVIFCLISLPFLLTETDKKGFFTAALAKSMYVSQPHSQISDAFSLSENVTYTDRIPAYDSVFYRIPLTKNRQIKISSKQKESLIFYWLDEKGDPVPFKKTEKPDTFFICPDKNALTEVSFLQVENHSTDTVSISLSYDLETGKKDAATRKPTATQKSITSENRAVSKKTANPKKNAVVHKRSASKKTAVPKKSTDIQRNPISKRKTTAEDTAAALVNSGSPENSDIQKSPAPKKNSDVSEYAISLEPHFIKLQPGQKKHLSFHFEKQNFQTSVSVKDFVWISTAPDIISVKNGKIFAKKEGIAIIFLQHKKESFLRSSALIKCFS